MNPSSDDRDRTGLLARQRDFDQAGLRGRHSESPHSDAVPDNTSILAVAGPRRPMTTEEQDRIHAYVEKGGHLLLLVDPETQAELESPAQALGTGLGPGVWSTLQDRLPRANLRLYSSAPLPNMKLRRI